MQYYPPSIPAIEQVPDDGLKLRMRCSDIS